MMIAIRAYCALLQEQRELAHDLLHRLFDNNPDQRLLSFIRVIPVVKTVILYEALRAGIAIQLSRQLVRHWEIPAPDQDIPRWPWPVRIRTMGGFGIEVEDEEIQFGRKAPRKPIALLKAIVAFGGTRVPERRLIDALWADEEGDAAANSMGVTLYRLRRILRVPDALSYDDGLISIEPSLCWVDTWALGRMLDPANFKLDAGGDPVGQLYAGPFLPDDIDAPWTAPMREKLRAGYLRCVSHIGHQYENAQDFERAANLYRQAIGADELAEDFYQGLMRCLGALDRRAEALSVFRQLEQTLLAGLDIAPSESSRRLQREIQRKAQSVPNP